VQVTFYAIITQLH